MNLNIILPLIAAVASAALATFVLIREKSSFEQRAFVAGMFVLAVESAFACLSVYTLLPEDMLKWQRFRLLAVALLPGAWLLFSLTYSRGNYREFLRRWKWTVAAAFLLPIGTVIGFWRALLEEAHPLEGASTWVLSLNRPGVIVAILFLLGTVAILMNLEKTLRASVGTMRWRVKFMVLGLGVLFGIRIYATTQTLLYSSIDQSLEWLNAGGLLVGSILIVWSLFRASLFSIDLYLSHRFLFSSLTFALVGAYLIVVGLFARLISYLGGPSALALKTFLIFIALLGLTMVLVSDRLRQKLTLFISRHLHRPRYDYRRVWSTFTDRTASLTSLPELCRAVVKIVSDTFEVLSVTIWLMDENRKRLVFGASTSLTEESARALTGSEAELEKIMKELQGLNSVIDIDQSDAPWVSGLKQIHPKVFPEGGDCVCVPLVAGEELLGLMAIGDRVNALPYTVEEFDLLKTIGDQVGAYLLSMRLSERLLESKQMEAFQTMSTFFVHDLKNTASTLSLMLQNLPGHFDDPEFRDDALKAISKSVDRINNLIRRLTLLRETLEIALVKTDLSDLVSAVLDDLEVGGPSRLSRELGPVPAIMVDPGQVKKIITNLVLNARDASPDDGEVRVKTAVQNEWVVVSVSDDGCGMTPEFMERSLFRPFQSTKKGGMGVGLFQSRMIAEAHRGRIEVQSEAGSGSMFRVLLPLQGG